MPLMDFLKKMKIYVKTGYLDNQIGGRSDRKN